MAAWLYPALPDPVPSHWNAEGEVDGYVAKPWGVMLLPLIALGMFALMRLIPLISPKGFRTDTFESVFNILPGDAFACFIGLLVLLAASGVDVRMNRMVFGAFAGVFFPLAVEWIAGSIVLAALVPVVYSYLVHRRVEGFEEKQP